MNRHHHHDARWGSRRTIRRGSSRALSHETDAPHRVTSKDTISLQRVLLDAYEYQGLNDLLLYAFFFTISVLALMFQWGPTTAAFKSNVLETYMSTGSSVSSIVSGAEQMLNFVHDNLNQSESLNVKNRTQMWIDQYGDASFVRIVVDLETPCKLKLKNGPACYEQHQENNSALIDFLNRWERLPSRREDNLRGSILVSQDAALFQNRTAMMRHIENLTVNGDLDVIGKYAYLVGLNFLAFDRIGDLGAVFNIWVGLSENPGSKPDHKLAKLSTTLPVLRDLWSTFEMKISLLFFAIFLLFTLYYTVYEFQWYKLCTLQYASRAKYFKYWWNDYQLASILLCYIWVIWYAYLVVIYVRAEQLWPTTNQDFARLQFHALLYTSWIYFGVFVTFVLGVRMCRYMRIHTGLKAFYQVFYDVARDMLDFAVFFIYVLVVLNIFLYSVFQISGGNPAWLRFDNGLTMLGRLMFNMLDYNDEFSNNATGIGTYRTIMTAVFWLMVLFLVLFSQNIMLAIFVSAYERAKQKSLQVEYSFLSLMWYRVIFGFHSLWHFAKMYVVSCAGSESGNLDPAEDVDAHSISMQYMSPNGSMAQHSSQTYSDAGFSSGNDQMHSQANGFNRDASVNGTRTRALRGSRHIAASSRNWVASMTSVSLPSAIQQYSYKLLEQRFQFGLHFLNQVNAKPTFDRRDRNLLYARWALSRLSEMKAVVAYFQDFGTLKLRKDTIWKCVGDEREDCVVVNANAHLTQNQLKQFLEAIIVKQKALDARQSVWNRWFQSRPFRDLNTGSVEFLCRALWEVYSLVHIHKADERNAHEQELSRGPSGSLSGVSTAAAAAEAAATEAQSAAKQLNLLVANLINEQQQLAQQMREQAMMQARMEQRLEDLVRLATRMAVVQTENMPLV